MSDYKPIKRIYCGENSMYELPVENGTDKFNKTVAFNQIV